MIRTIDADLSEAERVDEELLLFLDAAHRHHGTEEAARGHVGADAPRRPGPTVIVGFDDFVDQTCRVLHPQIFACEPFLDPVVLDAVPLDVFLPEGNRSARNRVAEKLNLSRARASSLAAIRKRGGDRSRLRVGVAVIEVIYRDVAIHE